MHANLNDFSVLCSGTKKWHKILHDVFSSQFSNPCLSPENPQLNVEIAFTFLHAPWTISISQR